MNRRIGVALAALTLVVAFAHPAAADRLTISDFTPKSGPTGSTVVISGRGMKRVNAVTFNGVAAKFTVNTARQITATVPAGASTGKFTLIRPGRSATTATDFTITTSTPSEATPWLTFRHDPQHTGRSPSNGPSGNTVHVEWIYKAVNWIKSEPSIGPDGTVYIGDSTFPLCALDPAAGTLRWCTDVGGYVNQSSPAIGNPYTKTDAHGTRQVQRIYMGDRNNVLHAIDAEGLPLWKFKINLDGDVRASPIIGPPPTNTVYMMCGCTTRGVLHAFTPDGTLKWVTDLPTVRDTSPAAILRGSVFRLYVVSNNGILHAIDDIGTSGRIAWTLSLGADNSHSSPTIGSNGTIYVGSTKGVFAVRDDGTSATVLPGWPVLTSGDVDTTAAIAGTKLYVSSIRSGTRTFYAIDAAANPPKKLWSVSGPGPTASSFAHIPSPVIGANGLVYAAVGSEIYAFDPASATPATPRWRHSLPDNAISLTLGEGVLYVTARDSRLYALQDGL
jgi:outer membrane protein assembly factor BamB